jgi:hypothetical protein
MLNLLYFHKQLAKWLRLRWISHYSRVTGKPPASGFSFKIFNSISQIPKSTWDKANTSGDIFLSSAYLKAVEKAPPQNLNFRYAIINKGNKILGIAYFQILALNYRLHQPSRQSIHSVNTNELLQKVHNKIIDTASTKLLVCGNAMISGEHGFCLTKIPEAQAIHVIAEIAYAIRKTANPRITATLIKDFCIKEEMHSNILFDFGYHFFNAGPNMVVPIRKNWTTFETYLNEMKPKYRKRAAKVIKKGSKVHRQSLTLEDIIKYRDELFELYCRVVDKAKFKLFFLSPDYFISLKRYLENYFECIGYFLANKMVGFTTRINNTSTLEGYVHGLLHDYNREFELYQNILLDDVKAAIASKSFYVNTGRTSMGMKSSIGAIPKGIGCYIRFSGSHSNHLIKPLFHFIKYTNEYCRNPFRDKPPEMS